MFRAIGFIGTGNMGSALARAADKGAAPGARLYLSNRTPAKAEALCNQLSRAQMSDNQEIARSCDTIFLGVKPQMMAAALKDLVPVLAARTDRFVVVSMAAGLTFETLTSLLGHLHGLFIGGNYSVGGGGPESPLLQQPYPLNGGSAGGAHRILHGAGMGLFSQI